MFLTTHYMEEADRLCHRLAIIDHGRIVADGSPRDLKRGIGGDTVALQLAAPGGETLAATQDEVAQILDGADRVSGIERTASGVTLTVADAHAAVPELMRQLDAAGVRILGLSMAQPTLDDVFLRYTGARIRAEEADQPLELGWN